jgi:hypothetical protein
MMASKLNPQLAYNLNKKKYYVYIINKNKKITNEKFRSYTPLYFNTSYDQMYYPYKQNPYL